jgi:hypothetical protein
MAAVLRELFDHEYKDNKIFRNVGELSRKNTASDAWKTWAHRNTAVRVCNVAISFLAAINEL